MRRCRSVMNVGLLGLLLVAGAALAQQPASFPVFELERLELNPGAAGSLLVGTGEVLPAGAWRLSTVGHYQHDPLVLSRGGQRLSIVGSRVTLHLLAGWSPTDWLEVAAQVPLVALQRGQDLGQHGIEQPAPMGLGTPSLSVRLGLLSQRLGGPVDVALGVGLGLPVGSTLGLMRDEAPRYSPQLLVGRRFGWFRLGLSAQGVLRSKLVTAPDALLPRMRVGNELRLGAVAATVGGRLRWELNLQATPSLAEEQRTTVELLAGSRYLVNPSLEVFGLAGVGMGSAPGTPLFRVMVGSAFGSVKPPRLPGESAVTCAPGLEHTHEECPNLDEDQDGLSNALDACPMDSGTLERNGCPLRDLDNDGFEDARDACPTAPGEARWTGCPMPDDDEDGVENDQDSCPDQRGLFEHRGCPKKDQDEDGIEDDLDACPKIPGIEKLKGCPEFDVDADGVSNRVDSCPSEAGTEQNFGCPSHELPLVTLSRTKLNLVGRVFFEPAHSRLQSRSHPLLDWVARVIHEHPEFPLIVVAAHTDDRGMPEDLRRLTQARAESVRQYLIEKGVAAQRLVAKGYGGDRPVDINTTSIGRELNRRVEFEIVWPD